MYQEVHIETSVVIEPKYLGKSLDESILNCFVKHNESRCTKYGFIRTGSSKLLEHDSGKLCNMMLNGMVRFNCVFKAEVLTLVEGSIVQGTVVGVNRYGFLADYESVAHIVVTHKDDSSRQLIPGMKIDIRIDGVRMDIGETRVVAHGHIVNADHPVPEDKTSEIIESEGEEDLVNDEVMDEETSESSESEVTEDVSEEESSVEEEDMTEDEIEEESTN